jgi:hypothetical protein
MRARAPALGRNVESSWADREILNLKKRISFSHTKTLCRLLMEKELEL